MGEGRVRGREGKDQGMEERWKKGEEKGGGSREGWSNTNYNTVQCDTNTVSLHSPYHAPPMQ